MRIKVLFFAALRERFSIPEKTLELSGPTRVEEVARRLGLEEQGLLFALNEEFVAADEPLKDNDTLAFLMPVSGGAV